MQRSRRGRGWRLQSMIRSLDHLDQSFQWWVMTVDWMGWRGILQRVAVCSVGGFQADEVTEGLVEGAHPPSQPWRMESTLAGPFPSPLAARFTSAHVPPHDCVSASNLDPSSLYRLHGHFALTLDLFSIS